MKKTELKFPTPLFLGFVQATGIFVYILTISYMMFNISRFVADVPTFLAPTLLLSLFVSSALITASMAFYHPIVLFFIRNKKSRAIQIVGSTAIFIAFYTLCVVSLLIYFS